MRVEPEQEGEEEEGEEEEEEELKLAISNLTPFLSTCCVRNPIHHKLKVSIKISLSTL